MSFAAAIEVQPEGAWNPGATSGEWSPGGCGSDWSCGCGNSCGGSKGDSGSCGSKPLGGSGDVSLLPNYDGEIWASSTMSVHHAEWNAWQSGREATIAESNPWMTSLASQSQMPGNHETMSPHIAWLAESIRQFAARMASPSALGSSEQAKDPTVWWLPNSAETVAPGSSAMSLEQLLARLRSALLSGNAFDTLGSWHERGYSDVQDTLAGALDELRAVLQRESLVVAAASWCTIHCRIHYFISGLFGGSNSVGVSLLWEVFEHFTWPVKLPLSEHLIDLLVCDRFGDWLSKHHLPPTWCSLVDAVPDDLVKWIGW